MTNSNVWETYLPRFNGDAPPGVSTDTHEIEYLVKELGVWDATDCPGWYAVDTYRFRDRRQPAPEVEDDGFITVHSSPPIMLPEGDADRLEYPMFDGLMAYFPNALAEVAQVSKIGNDQHNPGEPMHWARDKSTDHENKIMRHLVDIGTVDPKGVRHSARLAWRALALLQEEIERANGLPPSRASRNRTF